MSTTEHQPQELPPDPLDVALVMLDLVKDEYANSARAFAEKPRRRTLGMFNEATKSYVTSFDVTAQTILHEDMPLHQKAACISNLYVNMDTERVTLFKEIAPNGSFFYFEKDGETFAPDILRILQSGEPHDVLCRSFHLICLAGFEKDNKELKYAALPFGKTLQKAEQTASNHALDIAKVAAGAYIGVLLATHTTKRD